ncbi:MAG: C39 family peptidase [Patescibacteria group bacterium]|nr:C39 family peptidase [Patescibacteria group bacterium]
MSLKQAQRQKLNFRLKDRTKNTLFAVLFLFLQLSGLLIPSIVQADSDDENYQKINNIQQQINQIQGQLNQTTQQRITLQNEVANFDNQIYLISLQIQKLQLEINGVQAEIDETIAEIKKAEDELTRQKEFLKENLRVFYEEGQISSIEIIASSNNFSEYIDRTEYLKTLQDKIIETVNKINELKIQLDLKKKDLEVQKTKLLATKNEQDTQKAALDSQRYAKTMILDQVKGQEDNFQQLISKKQGDIRSIYNTIGKPPTGSALSIVNRYPHYYQHDPAWGNYNYDSGYTLAEFGCLITSLAMLRTYYGLPINPEQEAQQHSFSNGNLLWGSAQTIAGRNLIENAWYADWTNINISLAAGKPVIIGVHMGSYDHYVLLIGINNGTYLVNDPYFGSGGYDLSQVFQTIIYG